jgi:dTDP-4-amino-4,6-dideoxygalactose transaminase
VNVGLADLPLQHRLLKTEIDAAIEKVFSTAGFILGDSVTSLEKEIAEMCGAQYGIGVNSGTDALLLSMAAAGVGAGDEVITTPFTFVATAETIMLLGAVPVFVDIDLQTFNLDATKIEEKITSKTKAILPVHLFGQMADMDSMRQIANRHGLKLIGDGAQAIGCLQHNSPVATIGDATTLSFYPTKNLGGCGDGGMVLTNSEHIAEEMKLLRFHGSGGGYFYKRIGYCSRLDALQAAILLVKVKHLKDWNDARRRNGAYYNEVLADLDGRIHLPQTMTGNHHVYHQYTIRVEGGSNVRDSLQKHLAEQGVGSAVFYPLSLHLQDAYANLGYGPGSLPNSELVTSQVLSLPVHPHLTMEQAELVADSVRSFFA